MTVPCDTGSASGSGGDVTPECLYDVVSVGLALLTILLFSAVFVLLCVVIAKLRRVEQYFVIGKGVGGQKRSGNEYETSEHIVLEQTGLTTIEVAAATSNPSSTPDPGTQDPGTKSLEPMYSHVKKKRVSVKVEQYNEYSDPDMGELSLTHDPENRGNAKPPPKNTPWRVQVDQNCVPHTDWRQKRPSHSNRYSMPLLNERFNEEEPQPYIAPVTSTTHLVTEGKHMLSRDVEDSPPPLPSRLSCNLELVLESKDNEGERSGRGSTQYRNLPQPVMNEILYDEVSHTAPVKVHSVSDAPTLDSGKSNFGPELLYDEIK